MHNLSGSRKLLQTLLFFSLFIFHFTFSYCQSWQTLPNSPAQDFRHDDVCFTDVNMGWVVNIKGEVWKTIDGGNIWQKIFTQKTAFRDVGFIDSLNGFTGNLGRSAWTSFIDTIPLYKTHDGGYSWIPVTKFEGPTPEGICGMQVVDKNTIVAVGRVDGPPFFVRSTDGGNTWHSKDMQQYAGMLIDVLFTSRDTGFVIGGTDASRLKSAAIVLYTTDGGEHWKTKIKDAGKSNHCWKICHPTKNTFYVSIEELYMGNALKYFKSVDGGNTWKENQINNVPYGVSQGIGFVNDTVGWVGGAKYALSTTDGGKTFKQMPSNIFVNLNRIRMINDTLGYATGQRVYKYCKPMVTATGH